MDIDRARSDVGLAAPDPIEQLIAAQHPVGILDQKSQKLKFFQCQSDTSFTGEHFVGAEIDL